MEKKIAIGINGAQGKMGKVLRKAILKDGETFLSYAHDIKSQETSIKDLCKETEVVIDFSSGKGCQELVESALSCQGAKLLICSTGMSAQQMVILQHAATKIPILYAPNTSLGALLLAQLSQMAAKILDGKEFDVEIIDTHHKNKQDAPSGTALMIEQLLLMELKEKSNKPRVHLTSIRGGQVIGEHKVLFLGNAEEITIAHKVTDRSTFAKGALRAAKWLAQKKPGKLYTLQDTL